MQFAEQQSGCCPGTAEGAMAISIPPLAATWPRGLDLQPPPFPTSNQKTNASFCQLPEPPITNRKISAPFGEEPFRPLLQLPAHGGQILAITLAPDPPCSRLAFPRRSTTATASLAFQCCSSYFYIWLSNVSAHHFPPSSSAVGSWQENPPAPGSGEGR